MSKRKTHKEFVQEIFKKVGHEYEVIGEYKTSQAKVRFRHTLCNYEWDITPSSFLDGTRCPKCRGKVKKSTNEYKNFLYSLIGNEYNLIGEYAGSGVRILLQHKNCNQTFKILPSNINKDYKCPYCYGNKRTPQQFNQLVFEKEGTDYLVISQYINASSKILMKHNIFDCNTIFETTPSRFIHDNQRCPICNTNREIHKENYKEKLIQKYQNEYITFDEFEGSQTKMKFIHNIDGCGKIFYRTLYNLITLEVGCDCQLKSSKGERKIADILNKNLIKYINQYSFNDLKGERKLLRFDFAIFNSMNQLMCLIEYDGQQHFKSIEYFGGKNSFEKLRINDIKKNTYCRKNGIPLIRIPYWRFNDIELILNLVIHNEPVEVDETSFLVL